MVNIIEISYKPMPYSHDDSGERDHNSNGFHYHVYNDICNHIGEYLYYHPIQ